MPDRNQCEATAKSGERCRCFALPGERLCRVHGATQEQRTAWAAKGGRMRSRQAVDAEADPATLGPREVLGWLRARLTGAFLRVERGELEPGVAHALAGLANAATRAVSSELDCVVMAEIEERIEQIEGGADANDTGTWASPGAQAPHR